MTRRTLALRAGPASMPLLLVGFLLVSTRLAKEPGPAPQPAASRFAALVEQAQRHVRSTSVRALKARLDAGGKGLFLIDVREDGEWQAGHLPGAIHLSKGVIERDIEKTVPDPASEVILYCGVGARSVLAAESLQRMGYTNVFSLDGGARAWWAEVEPVVRK